MFSQLKLGTKIAGGFAAVILILVALSVYQISSMSNLGVLQDEGAGRSNDALQIGAIQNRVAQVYTVIADGIINRNMAETKADWAEVKSPVKEDIAKVYQLVDTDVERALARKFDEGYTEYLNMFEDRLLPILENGREDNLDEVRALDGELDAVRTAALNTLNGISDALKNETRDVLADEAVLRKLDEQIDQVREDVFSPLKAIVASLGEEQADADARFAVVADEVRNLALRASDAAKNTADLNEETKQTLRRSS